MSITVTVRDNDTGETEEQTIEDDYIVVTHGKVNLANAQVYPSTGTVVLTLKRSGGMA